MSDWPKPGTWYTGYALAAIANGRQAGHFVLDKHGRNVWVSLDPEWDRPFGLLNKPQQRRHWVTVCKWIGKR